jgi:diacylglycerol kinase family enzyme
MFIVINPYSGGGKALAKWSAIKKMIDLSTFTVTECVLSKGNTLNSALDKALSLGEKNFIAAGGDGTVNLLLNNLLELSSKRDITDISIGAIGLGSSNDFHKPFNKETLFENVPVTIDFASAIQRDLGKIEFLNNGNLITKYFLINASVGVTAEGNRFFNEPDSILKFLKKTQTSFAILYTAIKELIVFNNLKLKIKINNNDDGVSRISNIGIIKNPHFSGNLSYGNHINYCDGKFKLYVCSNMNKFELFKLLYELSKGSFKESSKSNYYLADTLEISSQEEFAIEYDGEIVVTDYVQFSLITKGFKVCNR